MLAKRLDSREVEEGVVQVGGGKVIGNVGNDLLGLAPELVRAGLVAPLGGNLTQKAQNLPQVPLSGRPWQRR